MQAHAHRMQPLVLAIALSMTGFTQAATKTWNCTNSTWQTSGCWNPTGVPGSTDDAHVYTVSSTNTLLKIDSSTGTAAASYLYVDNSVEGRTVTLQQTGGTLTTSSYEYLGRSNTGSFVQSGGTHTSNGILYLGYYSSGTGSYTLSGGTLDATAVIAGYYGTGSFAHSSGAHTADYLTLGGLSGSSGSYTLSGTGNLSVSNEYIGNSGSGSFEQGAGTHTVSSSLYLGNQSTGAGNYTQSGGSLNAGNTYVGYYGSGSFAQSAGSHSASYLRVGVYDTGNGSYTLSGSGTLATNYVDIGMTGTGSFTQSGGTHTVSGFGSLFLGHNSGASGSYTMSGGGLSTNNTYVGNSGTGNFTQSGGTHTVNNTLYIATSPGSSGSYSLQGGTLDANAVQNNGSFSQSGGTFVGNLVNEGTFTYSGGTFTGRLTNNAAMVLNASVSFSDGVENNANFASMGATRIVNFNGQGLTNNGTVSLSGGTLQGSGPIVNNASLSGYGAIGGSGGFTNNALLTQSGGNIEFSKTGTNQNLGNMDLASGRQFQIIGSTITLTNAGTINLNGGVVTGTGTLNNASGGTFTGRGTVSSKFGNAGLLLLQSGTTNVTQAFTNSGLIRLSSDAASLNGGAITNSGTIRGTGQVGNAITNSGTIEASGGTLTLGGALTNTGLMAAPAGGALIVTPGLATNTGVINLSGGTFDNNNHALANTRQISGYGTLRTSALTNAGSILLTGGSSTVNGPVVNSNSIEVAHDPALFTGAVTNNGLFKSTNTTVSFAGGYTENGLFFSDPATNIFTGDVVIGENGYWVGGVGDQFALGQDFINHSTRNTQWDTDAALLKFMLGPTHDVALAGADRGASFSGYVDNFAWGIVQIMAGQSLILSDGNAVAGAALYAGEIQGVQIDGDNASNIQGNGFNIYYDPTLANNAYLAGKAYGLGNGGMLAPVPEAEVWTMLLAGLGMVELVAHRRNRESRLTREVDA